MHHTHTHTRTYVYIYNDKLFNYILYIYIYLYLHCASFFLSLLSGGIVGQDDHKCKDQDDGILLYRLHRDCYSSIANLEFTEGHVLELGGKRKQRLRQMHLREHVADAVLTSTQINQWIRFFLRKLTLKWAAFPGSYSHDCPEGEATLTRHQGAASQGLSTLSVPRLKRCFGTGWVKPL